MKLICLIQQLQGGLLEKIINIVEDKKISCKTNINNIKNFDLLKYNTPPYDRISANTAILKEFKGDVVVRKDTNDIKQWTSLAELQVYGKNLMSKVDTNSNIKLTTDMRERQHPY